MEKMKRKKGVLRAVGSAKVYKYSTIAKEPPEVPKAYLLPYLPDILDQGSVQSCVAHSVAGKLSGTERGQGEDLGIGRLRPMAKTQRRGNVPRDGA